MGVRFPLSRTALEGYGRVVNGKLYTFGGYSSVTPFSIDNTGDVYDPTTNRWTYLGTIPVPETHSGVAVDDSTGSIYFVGGLRGSVQASHSSDVYRYDTATNKWSKLPSLPAPIGALGTRHSLTGSFTISAGSARQPRCRFLNPLCVVADRSCRRRCDMDDRGRHADCTDQLHQRRIVNGKIYIMGGEVGHDLLHEQQVETDAYDPATDSWTRIADMPMPKSHDESGTFVVDGKIVVAGGQVDDFVSTNNVSEYDPASDRWFVLPSLPNTLAGAIVQKIGSKLYAVSGYDGVSGITTLQTWTGSWGGAAPRS